MNTFETADSSRYGAQQSNGLVNPNEYHDAVDYSTTYTLAQVAEAKGRITRVRILTERTYGGTLCDISYIHATLADGSMVPVQVGVGNLTPLRQLKGELIKWAQREGVFAKGLGLLDEGNWSIQR
jgi:hypothetical protein